MKKFCIIPARYESTRFPGKPLYKILGKPLVEWVWQNASKISSFDDVFIATDSEEIEKVAKSFGGRVVKTLSSHKSGTDRVAEAARKLNISGKDIVVNIQSDEPLISPISVENLILSLNESSFDMATLGYLSSKKEDFYDDNVVKVVIDNNNFALYFSRSSIPHVGKSPDGKFSFIKHLGIYAYKMDFLQKIVQFPPSSLEKKERLEQLRVLENGCKIKVIMSEVDSESLNTKEDLGKIKELLQGKDS